jgi:MFS family permease
VSPSRWTVLGLGIAAQAAYAGLIQGFPALGPTITETYGLSLSGFGLMLGAVTLGATLSLVPWGLLTDRVGERAAISIGLAGAAGALALSATGGTLVLAVGLLAAGTLGAVFNIGSGRLVMGWFEPRRRGMAFGLRQAATPLGGAMAALALPLLVAGTGARAGLVALAIGCGAAAAACGIWLREPPPDGMRTGEGVGPLRDRRVYRLAAASGALVSAQACVIGFVTLFLHQAQGMGAVAAGAVLAVIQAVSVPVRVGIGRWSDRLGKRVTPLRWVTAAITVALVVTPLVFEARLEVLVPVVVTTGVLTFCWNGLSFNAVAEYADRGRSGTAIAIQQTALFAVAAAVQPAFGALVSATSWRVGFWALVVGPALAWWLLRPLAGAEAVDATARGLRDRPGGT